jgi:hypothetical protein
MKMKKHPTATASSQAVDRALQAALENQDGPSRSSLAMTTADCARQEGGPRSVGDLARRKKVASR